MTERIKYDPAQPYSFCNKCLKMAYTRKHGARWLCAPCWNKQVEHAKALAAAKAELEASRTPET